ncbi:hypothetical protein GCM10025865_11760 [Paraoerskovia sediminicola]|uniref:Phosphatidic acid phosphatase type 2/haloperoxidase domain-containing protein n=1 Tax=Paraoerskovia sediminicola TaxID=1138587 RepID=A0ABM8G1G8_9CELL|nr:phosphatase PAP2 family protein [Paraoerskovia sediminicola]BDZ41877.1 hypothetical protein GCM10025865_11760 [Paraoerskovia sediminicola]
MTDPSRPSYGPRVVAAVVATGAAALVWLVWRYFVGTPEGQLLDAAAFDGATYGQGRLWQLAEPVLDIVSVTFVAAGIVTAVVVALVRRRWGLAVQVAAVVIGANVTTQLLKYSVLDRVDLVGGWSESTNTLPSGHTTVAASVAVALLIAVPRGGRPIVALLGGGYAAATGVSTLVGQWHRPSDVVAALLVVLAWGAVVLALTPRTGLDRDTAALGRSSVGGGSWTVAVLLLVGGAAALVGAFAAGSEVLAAPAGATPTVTAYVGGALGVVGVTAVVFALLLLLRQSTAYPRPLQHGPVG